MYYKNILVTGGLGFIGSNFINLLFKNNHFKFNKLINIDKHGYASNKNNISDIVLNDKRYDLYEINLSNFKSLEKIFKKYEINLIIHFAAESHVDNSIQNPQEFIDNNIKSFLNLINLSKKHWNKKDKYFKFINVSTDEVFGSLKLKDKKSNEESRIKPRSPYSASKASCDIIGDSYYHTYKFPIITTNCCNNYGPNQFKEKLIPKIIFNYLNKKKIPIYGSGKNIREWIHVDDHNTAIIKIINKSKVGEKYCIGSGDEISNLNIAKKIILILKKNVIDHKKNLIEFVEDRKGHDFRYSINSTKLKKLGWKKEILFNKGLEKYILEEAKKIKF